ncbi:hypothetical protein ACP70R_047854 [Stipagrostis hirtigluma subsp. patula]
MGTASAAVSSAPPAAARDPQARAEQNAGQAVCPWRRGQGQADVDEPIAISKSDRDLSAAISAFFNKQD